MISKILVAVDGSEDSDKAFEYASYLAKRCEAPLLIVHVCVEFGKAADKWKEHDSFVKDLKEASTSMLKKYQTRAMESTIGNIRILEAPGDDVVKEVINIADEEQIDTIVVGSRGLKAPKEFLLGSVSYKMTHYAKCPVIVVR
ncbi:MAG TPA: universal stress protein [Candidatus Bathyarchaeia archaeon]|nr:universal stress protein [Candidatus Bathyarchaeia archaeon]